MLSVFVQQQKNGRNLQVLDIADDLYDEDDADMQRILRRLNGDQNHQGRHVRIACGDWKILHVRLYDY